MDTSLDYSVIEAFKVNKSKGDASPNEASATYRLPLLKNSDRNISSTVFEK